MLFRKIFRRVLIASVTFLFFNGAMPAFADDAPAADAATTPPPKTWKGSGEFGLSDASGNTNSQNINAKLGITQETDTWKNNLYGDMLRSRGQVTTTDADGNTVKSSQITANRYDLGGSLGYKFDPMNYMFGAARYEHDEFGTNLWQGTLSFGYGHIFIKSDTTNLFTEIGPGYKRYDPAGPEPVDQQAIGRGLLHFDYQITSSTKFVEELLVEAGSKNQYYQNDVGLAVSMSKALALKIGYEIRYNNPAPAGTEPADRLFTTNLIYSF